MKKLVIILFSMAMIWSCSSEDDPMTGTGGGGGPEPNDDCEGTNFTYTNDVASIINSSCAIAGCHVANNTQGLPVFTSYQGVFDRRGTVSNRVGAKTMPPSNSGITLTDDQIKTIVCWVKGGAPE